MIKLLPSHLHWGQSGMTLTDRYLIKFQVSNPQNVIYQFGNQKLEINTYLVSFK